MASLFLGCAGLVEAAAAEPPPTSDSAPTIPGYRKLNPAPPLDTLLAEGRRHSPLLKALNQETAAAEAMRSGADAFPAPVLGAEVGTRTVGMEGDMERMPMAGLSLQQMLPFPGKRGLMREAADAEAEAARAEAAMRTLDWSAMVRETVVSLWLTQRRLEVNFDHRLLLDQAVAAARKRYEVGLGSLGDILKAQTEVSELASEALSLEEEHRALEAKLNALLGATSERRYGPIVEAEEEEALASASLPPMDTLVAWGLRHRPELSALRAMETASAKEASAAGREAFPDFMLEGRWMAMEGPDEFGAMVGISLPFAPWAAKSWKARRQGAQAREKRAAAMRLETEGQLRAEVRAAVAAIEAARARRELAASATLPQARQALRSLEAAYGAGQADFMGLLDATHRVHRAHAALDDARAEWRRGWIALERAVARPVAVGSGGMGDWNVTGGAGADDENGDEVGDEAGDEIDAGKPEADSPPEGDGK